jgi:hypothetical protein
LVNVIGFELEAHVERIGNSADAEHLLQALIRYFVDSGRVPKEGETIDWASSLLVARNVAPARVALGELHFDGETVLPTVDRAVEIWTKQSQTCIEHGVELSPTRFGSMIAVSPHVLEGSKPIEGVRYEPTNVMSGWWLFTAEYDGTVDNFESMKPVHTFDVLRENIAVARYLGLPTGFAFRAYEPEGSWYEGMSG